MTKSAAFPRFKLTHDFSDDLGQVAATDIDRDRMLIGKWVHCSAANWLSTSKSTGMKVLIPPCRAAHIAPVDRGRANLLE